MSKTKHTPGGMTKEAEKMWAEAEFERWFTTKFSSCNPLKPWLRGVCLDAWMMAEKRQEEEVERLRAKLADSDADAKDATEQFNRTIAENQRVRDQNERMEWRLRYYTEPDRWLYFECGYCLNCGAHPETCECGEYTPRKLPET